MTSYNHSKQNESCQEVETRQCLVSTGKFKYLNIALVHDFLLYYGGAERVLEVFCEMFSEAPIYTLLYDKKRMRGKFADRDIRTSYLQKMPQFLRQRYQYLLPFMANAPETFDLREFDLVISSSGAWSKGIVTRLNTTHIAYIHSPMRFVWDYNERYVETHSASRTDKNYVSLHKLLSRPILNYLRVWDRLAADRPDYLIANSNYTKRRIEKYYRRKSEVVYPPIVSKLETPARNARLQTHMHCGQAIDAGGRNSKRNIKNVEEKNYFLVVSRLSPYKNVKLVVETFNKLGLPLIIIGEGKESKLLKNLAKENIKILGWQKDKIVKEYYQNARAFIFPAEDDFGLTAAEAMSWGTPVIALRKGGVREIVQEGITGEFFAAPTIEVLADGVRRFMEKEGSYNRETIKKSVEKFSKERFKREFLKVIEGIVFKIGR